MMNEWMEDRTTAMDHRDVQCILPSNGPSLQSSSEFSQSGFQERYDDREHGTFEPQGLGYPKFESPSPTENSSFMRNRNRPRPLTEREIESQTAYLCHRFNQCDAYTKYREKPERDGQKEVKWPDSMEMAFFKALVIYDAVGRTKIVTSDGKLRGRNELIAEAIRRWTGVPCARKQVSSHIQVLKPKVQHDPFIMSHLGNSKGGGGSSRRKDARGQRNLIKNKQHFRSLINRSRHPNERDALQSTSSYRQQPLLGSPISMASPSFPTPQGANFNQSLFEPHRFDMYVNNDQGVVHRFTKFRTPHARLPDLILPPPEDIWPPLASVLNDKNPSCDMIFAESTLELTTSLPKGAALGIEFSISTNCKLDKYEHFECETCFFDNDTLIEDAFTDDRDERIKRSKSIKEFDYDDRRHMIRNLAFGSGFWATRISKLANKIIEAGKYIQKASDAALAGDSGQAASAKQHVQVLEHEINSILTKLSAVQEIYATPRGGFGQRDRLLVIFWKFKRAPVDRPGETTWRNMLASADLSATQGGSGKDLSPDFGSVALNMTGSTHDSMSLADTHSQLQLLLPSYSAVGPLPSIITCGSNIHSLLTPTSSIYHHSAHGSEAGVGTNSVGFGGGPLHMGLSIDPEPAPLFHDDHGSQVGGSASSNVGSMFGHSQPWPATAYGTPYFDDNVPIYHHHDGHHVTRSFGDASGAEEAMHVAVPSVPRHVAGQSRHEGITESGAVSTSDGGLQASLAES